MGEDEPVGPVDADDRALVGAVCAQGRDGAAVQGDGARTGGGGGLRWQQHLSPDVLLQGPANGEGCLVEIKIGPAESGCFSAAQPAQRDEVEHRVELVVFDGA
jgi:hypothetical protein